MAQYMHGMAWHGPLSKCVHACVRANACGPLSKCVHACVRAKACGSAQFEHVPVCMSHCDDL
eukprot:756225-Pelagomonas_calceolata.AAC.2